jgi:hypothetical protein
MVRRHQSRFSWGQTKGCLLAPNVSPEYLLKRWDAFTYFLDDGRLCVTNNAAERELRAVAIGRKNWTFAGSDEGASYCSCRHPFIKAAYFVGDYQAAGVLTGARRLHYGRIRTPSRLAG